MSRLIVVSNRVAPISEGGPAAGGLAVGVFDALKETGGVWFGWSGDVRQRDRRQRRLDARRARAGDLRDRRSHAQGLRPVLPRLLERDAVAGVPLSQRPDPLRARGIRRLLPRQRVARAQAAHAARSPTTSSGFTTIT